MLTAVANRDLLGSLIAAVLCFCVLLSGTSPAALAQKKTAPNEATPPPLREEFKMGEVDLELLEQVNLLDKRFERDGMVLEDPVTNAHLMRIGRVLIPKGLEIDYVAWKFRAWRDPQPNALNCRTAGSGSTMTRQ